MEWFISPPPPEFSILVESFKEIPCPLPYSWWHLVQSWHKNWTVLDLHSGFLSQTLKSFQIVIQLFWFCGTHQILSSPQVDTNAWSLSTTQMVLHNCIILLAQQKLCNCQRWSGDLHSSLPRATIALSFLLHHLCSYPINETSITIMFSPLSTK